MSIKLDYLIDPQQQTCKICFKKDKINFNVNDDVWETIVPDEYKNRVVCLACFDALAKLKNINYTIESLYFAGEIKTFAVYNL